MIFVDFEDAPASETTQGLFDPIVPNAIRWYREASFGQLTLQVTSVPKWFRMIRSSASYALARGLTFATHRAYIDEAMKLADADVDFRQYSIVYIVASAGSAVPLSPTFVARQGTGIMVDDTEIRFAVTFGADIRNRRADYGSHVLIHETGHIFGLPDLYDFSAPNLLDSLRHAGGWDVMSWVATGADFFAWHKWKLGWLDDRQILCIPAGSGPSEAELTPIEAPGGLKAVVMFTGEATAVVLEARMKIGLDAQLCAAGVLAYSVDAAVETGRGPIRVIPARVGVEQQQRAQCGPLYDAPFGTGEGRPSRLEVTGTGITAEVLQVQTDRVRVRVQRR